MSAPVKSDRIWWSCAQGHEFRSARRPGFCSADHDGERCVSGRLAGPFKSRNKAAAAAPTV